MRRPHCCKNCTNRGLIQYFNHPLFDKTFLTKMLFVAGLGTFEIVLDNLMNFDTLRCQLNEQGQINKQGGFSLNTLVCLCVCFFLHVSLVPNKRVYSSIWHPRIGIHTIGTQNNSDTKKSSVFELRCTRKMPTNLIWVLRSSAHLASGRRA